MKYLVIIVVFLSSFSMFGQEVGAYYDTKEPYYPVKNTVQTDSLKYWLYTVDYNRVESKDSIKTIGQIRFWRTTTVYDKKSMEVYGKPWRPSIAFDVYHIADFEFCEQTVMNIKRISSCLPPALGGDLMIVQNYVLMNRSVCVNCIRYDNQVDYCRPTLNKIFSELTITDNSTLKDLDMAIGKTLTRVD